MVNNYVLKVMVEVLATPVTYRIVAWLKDKEGVDVYDTNTDFNSSTSPSWAGRTCSGVSASNRA